MEKRITLDRKIQGILDRGPMAALYFAATIRHCVEEIDKTLNQQPNNNHLQGVEK